MDKVLKSISYITLTIFISTTYVILYCFCDRAEHIHHKLFYKNITDVLIVKLNYFGGWPLITLNMEFFSPLLWVSFKYTLLFYLFLVIHKMSDDRFLNPGRDAYSITYLNRGYWGHLLCAMNFGFRHFGMLCYVYGMMAMFGFRCPTPLLRELIALYIWHGFFGWFLSRKIHISLSPFIMVRPFYLTMMFLIVIEYNLPGRTWEIINLLPIAYALWFLRVGQFQERHCGILFYDYVVPEKGDNLYDEYIRLRKEGSLVFRFKEYIKEKIGYNQEYVQ